MGGGVILLAIMVNLIPITQAMVYHGVIQFFANGFRAALHYQAISIRILALYILGSVIGSYFLFQIIYSPNKGLILLTLGLITLFGPYLKFVKLDVRTPLGAISCGILVSWLNTLVGASGPLLNMFFLKSNLNRFQVIATKSATQTIAHFIKVLFYTGIFSAMKEVSLNEASLFLVFLSSLTFLGGWLGKKVLHRMSEEAFRRYGFLIISGFGAIFTLQGLYLLWF